jgi:serine/threonine-protein kinase
MVEKVAGHLSTCVRCEALLHDLPEQEDSLVEDLRRAAKERPTDDFREVTTGPRDKAPGVDVLFSTGPARLPARLGQYELLEPLGRGGMGVVYKARQISLNRVVAVKLALCGPLPGTEAFARFKVEGEAIGQLQHDNIVRVYEFGEHDGRPYLSMDYVEGGTLSQKLSGRPLPDKEAASLVQTLARAVHFAHRHRIIHRDLKPANVLIDAGGSVKLTDFSLAKLMDAEEGQTVSHALIGTPSYMAPEQARGNAKDVGPLADVYGLGAILYETLTGQPPFRAATREETLKEVQSQEPRPPSRLRPGLSRDLEAVCLKCLEKDAKKRYASAEALAEDLARWLRGKPTEARPRRWPARVYRAARKHALGLSFAAIIFCGSAVLYWRDPERPIRQIESTLAQRQPVYLIDETGKPRWFRIRLGEERTQISLAGDGTFAVHSWALCLLELVRDPQQDRYRFRARVRHVNSDPLGEVGVYLAHRSFPGYEADIHVFTQLTFNDVRDNRDLAKLLPPNVPKPPPLKGNVVELFPHLTSWDKDGEKSFERMGGVAGALFKAAGEGAGPWHELEVIVTPQNLRATWDGQLVGELPVARIVDRMDKALTERRRLHPNDPLVGRVSSDFRPRGSLGLYVYRGSAHFRSVRLEPVAD